MGAWDRWPSAHRSCFGPLASVTWEGGLAPGGDSCRLVHTLGHGLHGRRAFFFHTFEVRLGGRL